MTLPSSGALPPHYLPVPCYRVCRQQASRGHPLDRGAGRQCRADCASGGTEAPDPETEGGRVVQRCGLRAILGRAERGRWDCGGPQVVTRSRSPSLRLPRQRHLCCLGGVRLGPRVPPGTQSAPGPLLAPAPAWPTLCLGGRPEPTPGMDPRSQALCLWTPQRVRLA